MPLIVLDPGVMELGVNQDAYDALVKDLEREGYQVRLNPPIERRDAVTAAQVTDLAVHLVDEAARTAIDAIVTLIVARVAASRLNKRRTRTATIYGARGEVLREVPLRDPPE